MYVCLCNGITEGDIQEAVSNGLRSLSQLREHLNVSSCCGSCAEHAEACLAEAVPEGDNAYPAEQFRAIA